MGRMMLLRKVNVDVVVEGDGMMEVVVEDQRDSYYFTLPLSPQWSVYSDYIVIGQWTIMI